MPLDINVLGRGIPHTGDLADRLRKSQIVGELVVFAVDSYEEAKPGRYGPEPFVQVDLLVVTGPLSGQRDRSWATWGALARQMGEQSGNGSVVAKVNSGQGSRPGSHWFGLELDVTDEDVAEARRVLSGQLAPARTAPAARSVWDQPVKHEPAPF